MNQEQKTAESEWNERFARRFPRANGGGWTISPRLLKRIADETTEIAHDFRCDMEEVEAVLLALERIYARDETAIDQDKKEIARLREEVAAWRALFPQYEYRNRAIRFQGVR